MISAHFIEAQKRAEAGWVEDGRKKFMEHCERSQRAGSPGLPTGREAMKRCAVDFMAHLEAEEDRISKLKRPMANCIYPVLSCLGLEHVVAITIHQALMGIWKFGDGTSAQSDSVKALALLPRAQGLGVALEHDLRFRQFAQSTRGMDKDSPEKLALARMQKNAVLNTRNIKARLAVIQDLTSDEWTDEFRICVGSDLLAHLVAACPHTFIAPLTRYGGRTIRTLRLTVEAADAITTAIDVAAVNHPRYRAMRGVPPRPWQYREATKDPSARPG